MSRSEEPSELLRRALSRTCEQKPKRKLREEMGGQYFSDAPAFTAMNKKREIFAGSYVGVRQLRGKPLETENFLKALQAYARKISRNANHSSRRRDARSRGNRAVIARRTGALPSFAKYQTDFKKLNRILDAYEPAANRIANNRGGRIRAKSANASFRQQQESYPRTFNSCFASPVSGLLISSHHRGH